MKTILTITCAALALTACAKRPDAIAPISMGPGAYDSLTCERAASMRNSTREALTALEGQQRNAATADAVGVFLIAVPVSSLTGGDKEGLIATEKGKINALDERLIRCDVVAG